MFEELLWFALVVILVVFVVNRLSADQNLPPGPFPLPIIGNAHKLASAQRHVDLTNMEKQYGKVFSLYLGGQLVVVISGKALKDALITKSSETAGRPRTHTANIYSHCGKGVIFGDYSLKWKLHRKIVHSALKMYSTGMLKLESVVSQEFELLSKRLESAESQPHDITKEIRLTVMNVICALVFGSRFDLQDPEFTKFVDITSTLAALVSTGSIVDMIPCLKIFPFKSLQRLKQVCRERDDVVRKIYEKHLEANRVDKPLDLTDAFLKAKKEAEEEDSTIKGFLTDQDLVMTMSEVFVAGFETTASTINWALLYLLHNPEVQDKLHKELDQVIGPERLPGLKDRKSLPYLEATFTETLRISSLVPLAVPHMTTVDTTLQGYSIPKGTTLLANLWSLHHDPSVWENPHDFKPERFLDEDGNYVAPKADRLLPFSTGRRVCLGESLARMEVFVILSRLLHRFKFKNPPGCPPPSLQPTPGIALIPKPFFVCAMKRQSALDLDL